MPEPSAKPFLERGARCNNTAALQHALNLNCKMDKALEIDGIFGEATDTAVRKFQKQSGIKIDGRVGNITGGQLFDIVSLTRTLSVEIPKPVSTLLASSGTPKPPALTPPTFNDVTGTLLARQRYVGGWLQTPRVEKNILKLPQLAMPLAGLSPEAMNAHGIGTQILRSLPVVGPLFDPAKSFQIAATLDFAGKIALVKTVPIVVMPKGGFEFGLTPRISLGDISAEARLSLGPPPIGVQFGNILTMRAGVETWGGMRGSVGLGGVAGELTAGAQAKLGAELRLVRTPVALGPFRRGLGIDLFLNAHAGFNARLTVSSGRGIEGQYLAPDFGGLLGLSVFLEKAEPPRR